MSEIAKIKEDYEDPRDVEAAAKLGKLLDTDPLRRARQMRALLRVVVATGSQQ